MNTRFLIAIATALLCGCALFQHEEQGLVYPARYQAYIAESMADAVRRSGGASYDYERWEWRFKVGPERKGNWWGQYRDGAFWMGYTVQDRGDRKYVTTIFTDGNGNTQGPRYGTWEAMNGLSHQVFGVMADGNNGWKWPR